MTTPSIVRSSGEGEKRWFFGGGLHTWKATADETNGAFLCFEDHMTQGKMTPFHTHPEADEVFYVLTRSFCACRHPAPAKCSSITPASQRPTER